MSEQWKPGALAMVECSDRTWRRAFCVEYRADQNWEFSDGRLRSVVGSKARPLAVIDPEDREQVRAIANAAFPTEMSNTNRLQAALREFAKPTPPKPEEPLGLGAVVVDAKGFTYVRGFEPGTSHTHPWHVIDPAANVCMAWWTWDDIDVASVEHDGWVKP